MAREEVFTMTSEEMQTNRQFLLDTAKRLLEEKPDAKQVILLQANTADGLKLYFYYCTDPSLQAQENEDACIRKMQADGNTWVVNILCMDNVEAEPPCIPLNVPCWTIRKKVRALDFRNDAACVLGWGDYKTPNGIGGKSLCVVDMIPKRKS